MSYDNPYTNTYLGLMPGQLAAAPPDAPSPPAAQPPEPPSQGGVLGSGLDLGQIYDYGKQGMNIAVVGVFGAASGVLTN